MTIGLPCFAVTVQPMSLKVGLATTIFTFDDLLIFPCGEVFYFREFPVPALSLVMSLLMVSQDQTSACITNLQRGPAIQPSLEPILDFFYFLQDRCCLWSCYPAFCHRQAVKHFFWVRPYLLYNFTTQ